MLGPSRARGVLACLAFAVTAALLAAGCTADSDDRGGETSRRQRTVKGCDVVACRGQLDGARYEVRLPKSWNGSLLIYSHGYRHPAPAPPDFEPVDTEPAVAASDATAETLLAEGYALIGSSFAKNGWAYQEGVRAGEQLYAWFSKNVAEPDRVYVWGDSLGGLITQGIAEKHPEWVSGVAPMCGVLAGLNLNLDLALDLAYAVKTLLYPEMKLTGYASYDEALSTFTEAQKRVMAATKNPKTGLPKLLAIQSVLDGPTKTARFDGRSVTAQASAVVESVLTGLVYGTIARYDVEQRIGGNPSGNTSVDYASRVSDAERALAETLAPGGLATALTALAKGTRVAADEGVRRNAQSLGDPSGVLKDRTITLHTAYDPLVLVQNETVFAERVDQAKDRKADIVQLYTQPPQTYGSRAPYGAGHCNFTDGERVGLITLLDDWVTRGLFPSPTAVDKAIVGANGYAPDFTPGPWPAYATS